MHMRTISFILDISSCGNQPDTVSALGFSVPETDAALLADLPATWERVTGGTGALELGRLPGSLDVDFADPAP